MGNALVSACDHIKSRLKQYVREYIGEELVDFAYKRGNIITSHREIPLQEILQERFGKLKCEVIGEGTSSGMREQNHPLGGPAPFFEAVATAVELTVDKETGEVDIQKIVHVSDVGKAINPVRASGVDEGGNIMGVGIALSEELFYNKTGELLNGSSLDYRIPTIADTPREMITRFQENSDGPGTQGAKGLGEGGILAIVPAISGAIFDATGIMFTEIPITPEKIWRAGQKEEEKNAEEKDGVR
jgi:CO/xanthine dehydrogenase Mo-binding subunit